MQNIKKVFTFMVLLIVVSSIFGQVPSSFKYQAVLRDARGNIKANIATQITISVLKENANGTVVFSETHDATTDGYGLINLEIGKGTPTVRTLSDIDWGVSTYFIKVDVDGVEMGTSQLLSVPYALYAKTAGNVTGNITETDPVFTGSQAAIITANHITKLNNLSGSNTGDQNLSGFATTATLTSVLGNKVDKVAGKGLSANDYTTIEKTKLTAITGTNTGDQNITAITHSNRVALDAVTGKNTGDQDLNGLATTSSVTTTLNSKVDKVAGKGLSTNDYTTTEKTKLATITGTNTGDQDVTAITHSNRVALDSVSGKNTGDQDLESILVKGTDAGNKKIVNAIQLGVGTVTPDLSSALEIKSTTQGFLPPRMTYIQKLAIVSPGAGLIIWCSNCGESGEIQVYNGKMWTNLIGGSVTASLPIISLTTKVYSITKTTATSGGNVTSDGGATLTLRGVCWSTKVNPTVALSTKTIDGTGTGVFSSSLTGLSADSTYYVRAYATNSAGTVYGSSITFTTITNHVVPTLTTVATTNVATTTATSGGNVTADGGTIITARGVCWSTKLNPTIVLNTKTTNGTGTGIFSSSLTGLNADSTYYVRAYATNSTGTSYGSSVTFTTITNHVAPKLTTSATTNVAQTTATSGANVTSDGGTIITARGVCWSTKLNPTIVLNTKTTNGTGTGIFSSSLTGLGADSTYFVRAYATNSIGTSYGSSITLSTITNHVVPTLTTTTTTNVAQTTATSGGNVTSDGGTIITARGVCWSTKVNPTVALNTKTTNGTGTGIFSSSLTGLGADSTYYVRAYATNSIGTSYGNSITFSTITNHVVPTLTTTATTNVAQTTAASGGNVTSDGGTTITSRGVCWSISANPTVALNVKTTDGTGTGSFTSNLNGLTSNTSYYLRAYATNSTGTGYGSEVKFNTATSTSGTVTDIDGNVYKTVTIGRQVWMAENLKTTKYRNGEIIGTTTLDIEAENAPKYQWAYGGSISNVDIYGRLYTWYAANDSRGVCPTGWNLPSVNQMYELIISADVINPGYALKETGTTHWNPNLQDPTNSHVTNSSGFTGLPAGGRLVNGTFDFLHETTAFWTTETSTQEKVGYAHNLNANTLNNVFFTSTIIKNIGASVRCLKDNIPGSVVIPTLNTTIASNIATTSAISGGNISSDGGATVTARGVCWSMTTNPTVALNTKTWDDYGTGIFTSSLTGLAAGTTYYIRSYSTNSAGTSYGTELTFATLANPVVPVLTTTAATNIAQTSATCGGNVTSDGGAAITARGVCWSTAVNPTVALSTKTSNGTGTGVFLSSLTGLTAGTTYFVRSYATNSAGTAYGAELSFKTSILSIGTTVTDIDGNVYNTVTIGSQVWMVENLKTTKYRNGNTIPNVTEGQAWTGLTTGGYCWYNNDAPTNKASYGALYNWYAVADLRNIAPLGWHIPSDAEWIILTDFLGGLSVAGGKMKETGTTHWLSPNVGATNSSGFTSISSGGRLNNDGMYIAEGNNHVVASSTVIDASFVRGYSLSNSSIELHRGICYRNMGYSVRCVKD